MDEYRLNGEVKALIEAHNPHLESQEELIAKVYRLGLEHGNAIWQNLSEAKQKQLEEWKKAQDRKFAARQNRPTPYYGASGGAYVYTSCFTSLGVVIKVRNDATGEKLDLTDYHDW